MPVPDPPPTIDVTQQCSTPLAAAGSSTSCGLSTGFRIHVKGLSHTTAAPVSDHTVVVGFYWPMANSCPSSSNGVHQESVVRGGREAQEEGERRRQEEGADEDLMRGAYSPGRRGAAYDRPRGGHAVRAL